MQGDENDMSRNRSTINADVLRSLLERAAGGEDIDHLIDCHNAEQRTNRAQRHLEDLIHDDDDMTGQDNEERINGAADDLIRSRDRELRIRDPDSYAEQKHFGLLG